MSIRAPEAGHVREIRRRKLIVVLTVALVLALALAVGFYLGQMATYSGMGRNPTSYRTLQAQLLASQDKLSERESELEVQRTRHAVDRAALEMVRSDLATQNEQIAGLEEGLNFYRSLMVPGDLDKGLSIRGIELVAGAESRHYAYRIVLLQQQARKQPMVVGKLHVTVTGMQAEEPLEYPLGAISGGLTEDAIAIKFRYFQSVEGELTVPEGFEPQSVRVTAQVTKPRKIEVGEEFPWQLQERFTHAGK